MPWRGTGRHFSQDTPLDAHSLSESASGCLFPSGTCWWMLIPSTTCQVQILAAKAAAELEFPPGALEGCPSPGLAHPACGRGAEAKPHSAQVSSHLQFPLVSRYAPLRALAHEAPRHLSPGDPCTWSYSKTPTGMEPAAQHPMGPSVVRWWDQRAGPLWGKVHGLEGCPVYPARAWQAAGGGESNKIHVRV